MKALSPWRAMRDLEPFERRMEDLFERMRERFFGPGDESVFGSQGWLPAIESCRDDGNLVVKADLPGIDPKEVSISVLGNQLVIEGERKREEKKEEKDYFYQERAYGKFTRRVPLPEGVDAEKIKAHYKNGVLEITMPAPKEMVSKKIAIEAK